MNILKKFDELRKQKIKNAVELREKHYVPVWTSGYINGPKSYELMTSLNEAINTDDAIGLESVILEIASKYGVQYAMRTKAFDVNASSYVRLSNRSGFSGSSYGFIHSNDSREGCDWFSTAVEKQSFKCIKWALENKWASPLQKIEADSPQHSTLKPKWSGEKTTLRALCWSGLYDVDWLDMAKTDHRWLEFCDFNFVSKDDIFLVKALSAVIAPNLKYVHHVRRHQNDEIRGISGLEEVPRHMHHRYYSTLSEKTYFELEKIGLCTKTDIYNFMQEMKESSVLRERHFNEGLHSKIEGELLKHSCKNILSDVNLISGGKQNVL